MSNNTSSLYGLELMSNESTTTVATSIEESKLCDTWDTFYHTIHGIMMIFGFFGNGLTVYVMWPEKNRSPTSFLLVVLAIVDFFVCLAIFALITVRDLLKVTHASRLVLTHSVLYWQVFVRPFSSICHMATTWVVLQVTIHRYILVCLPHRAPVYGTLRVARYQAIGAIALSVVYNIPKMFEHVIIYKDGVAQWYKVRDAYHDNWAYEIFYKVILYYLLIFVIPIVTLSILTYRLIKTVKEANKKREEMTHGASEKNDITKSLVTVVIIFLVCQISNPIRRLWSVSVPAYKLACPYAYAFFYSITGLLVGFNSSTNFVIYMVCARRFRRRLLYLFKIGKGRVEPIGGAFTVTGTAGNTVQNISNTHAS